MEETTGATPEQVTEAPRHAAEEVWPGSHTPLADPNAAPEGFPIKGNADSGLYHVPGSAFYDRTVAEVWFASAEAAEAAGFQLPPSQRKDAEPESAPVAEPQPETVPEPEPVAEAEPATIAPETAPAPEAEPEPQPEPESQPEPAATAPYVSSFADTGAAPRPPAAGNPLVKRLLVSLGAGAIAFLVLRKGLRRKG